MVVSNDGCPDHQTRVVVTEVSRAGHNKTFQPFGRAGRPLAPSRFKPNKTQVQGVGIGVCPISAGYSDPPRLQYTPRAMTTIGNRPRNTDTGELAGRTQADELYRLLAECSANGIADEASERVFLTRMGMPELRSIKDVPVGHFVRLKNALLTKKGIMAQRAAQANTNIDIKAGDVK